jgi:hypothetical protein
MGRSVPAAMFIYSYNQEILSTVLCNLIRVGSNSKVLRPFAFFHKEACSKQDIILVGFSQTSFWFGSKTVETQHSSSEGFGWRVHLDPGD